jgi:competence protein ComEC
MTHLPVASALLLTGLLQLGCSPTPPVGLSTEEHVVHDTGWQEPDTWDNPLYPEGTSPPARQDDATAPEDTGEPPVDDDPPPDDDPPVDAAEGTLRLVMIDVGQADALLLVGPDGTSMLVDGGKSGSDDEIERALEDAGVSRLDYTLLSHMHADHLGAMDEVLADHPEVRRCYDHGGTASSNAYGDYAAEAVGCRATLRTGDSLDLGPGVQADILHPGSPGDSDENANSVVLRVSFAGVTLLLGGDCPEDGCEERLDPGPVDIYKVHHHGSAGASSRAFMDRIQPDLALISVGSNSYGHPTADAMDRIEAAGATIMRSDQHGDVTVLVDAEGWWVE